MKISAKEEYGLRILLCIARNKGDAGMTISQISEKEGLSHQNVAKLCRVLRLSGLINSNRGQQGGYTLSKPADQIVVGDILNVLDGKLFDQDFCMDHSGMPKLCTNSVDCSIRSLWRIVQHSVDNVLNNLTLKDLISSEENLYNACKPLVEEAQSNI